MILTPGLTDCCFSWQDCVCLYNKNRHSCSYWWLDWPKWLRAASLSESCPYK